MLTLGTVQKMYAKPEYMTVTKSPCGNSNVSKKALDTALSCINSYRGFITIKTLEFRTNYAQSTLQKVISLLAYDLKIQTKTVKNGKERVLYVKGINK